MRWPKKIHTRNLITKKNSCRSKISPPPHNFSNGPSLKGVIWDTTYWLDNLSLVITKGYGIQATRIEFQNTFAPALYFAWVSRDKWPENAWSDYEWQRVQTQVTKLHFVHWPHSMLATNMQCMRNSNLEIRIADENKAVSVAVSTVAGYHSKISYICWQTSYLKP